MRLSLRSASAFSLRSLAPLALVLSFSDMTNSERVEAVCNELFNADVWVGDNIKSSKVAAFIVERDAKRDSAWMRYADARVEKRIAENALDDVATSEARGELYEAKETLRAVGIDTEAL